jgi:voltage-gated potassium channel Kch
VALSGDFKSKWGTIFAVLLNLVVLLSLINMLLSSLPQYRTPGMMPSTDPKLRTFLVVEAFCVMVFTLEFVSRLVSVTAATWDEIAGIRPSSRSVAAGGAALAAHSSESGDGSSGASRWRCCLRQRVAPAARKALRFLFSFNTLVDLASFVPWYVEFGQTGWANQSIDGDTTVLRVLRVARVLQLIKLTGKTDSFQVMVRTIRSSLLALGLIVLYLFILMTFFAALVFYFESGDYDAATGIWMRPDVTGTTTEPTPFLSVFHGMWFICTTLSTTGYGDFVPTSVGGRLVSVMVMLTGMVTLAMPISVLTARFPVEFHAFERKRKEKAAHRKAQMALRALQNAQRRAAGLPRTLSARLLSASCVCGAASAVDAGAQSPSSGGTPAAAGAGATDVPVKLQQLTLASHAMHAGQQQQPSSGAGFAGAGFSGAYPPPATAQQAHLHQQLQAYAAAFAAAAAGSGGGGAGFSPHGYRYAGAPAMGVPSSSAAGQLHPAQPPGGHALQHIGAGSVGTGGFGGDPTAGDVSEAGGIAVPRTASELSAATSATTASTRTGHTSYSAGTGVTNPAAAVPGLAVGPGAAAAAAAAAAGGSDGYRAAAASSGMLSSAGNASIRALRASLSPRMAGAAGFGPEPAAAGFGGGISGNISGLPVPGPALGPGGLPLAMPGAGSGITAVDVAAGGVRSRPARRFVYEAGASIGRNGGGASMIVGQGSYGSVAAASLGGGGGGAFPAHRSLQGAFAPLMPMASPRRGSVFPAGQLPSAGGGAPTGGHASSMQGGTEGGEGGSTAGSEATGTSGFGAAGGPEVQWPAAPSGSFRRFPPGSRRASAMLASPGAAAAAGAALQQLQQQQLQQQQQLLAQFQQMGPANPLAFTPSDPAGMLGAPRGSLSPPADSPGVGGGGDFGALPGDRASGPQLGGFEASGTPGSPGAFPPLDAVQMQALLMQLQQQQQGFLGAPGFGGGFGGFGGGGGSVGFGGGLRGDGDSVDMGEDYVDTWDVLDKLGEMSGALYQQSNMLAMLFQEMKGVRAAVAALEKKTAQAAAAVQAATRATAQQQQLQGQQGQGQQGQGQPGQQQRLAPATAAGTVSASAGAPRAAAAHGVSGAVAGNLASGGSAAAAPAAGRHGDSDAAAARAASTWPPPPPPPGAAPTSALQPRRAMPPVRLSLVTARSSESSCGPEDGAGSGETGAAGFAPAVEAVRGPTAASPAEPSVGSVTSGPGAVSAAGRNATRAPRVSWAASLAPAASGAQPAAPGPLGPLHALVGTAASVSEEGPPTTPQAGADASAEAATQAATQAVRLAGDTAPSLGLAGASLSPTPLLRGLSSRQTDERQLRPSAAATGDVAPDAAETGLAAGPPFGSRLAVGPDLAAAGGRRGSVQATAGARLSVVYEAPAGAGGEGDGGELSNRTPSPAFSAGGNGVGGSPAP